MNKKIKIFAVILTFALMIGCTLAFTACGGEKPAEPAVTEITVDASEAKIEYEDHETFTTEGVAVTAKYDDGNTEAVKISDCTVSAPDMTKIGEQNVTVTYEGKSATYVITIVEHECGSVCPECGKCLDLDCENPKCEEKCTVDGERYTFFATDSKATLLAGIYGPGAPSEDEEGLSHLGFWGNGATVAYNINAEKATVATLLLCVNQWDFVLTEHMEIYVNGEKLDRPTTGPGELDWEVYPDWNLGCINLNEGSNVITFTSIDAIVNFRGMTVVSPEKLDWYTDYSFTVNSDNVKTEYTAGEEFDVTGLTASLTVGGVTTALGAGDVTVYPPDTAVAGEYDVLVVYQRCYTATFKVTVTAE